MFLLIADTMNLEELQERFQECFPYLRIAFYSSKHKRFEPSENDFLLDGKQLVGDVRSVHENGALEIKSWFTVARVEGDLKKKFGLHAQIFRSNKKGECIQTSLSDSLTLEEQSRFAYDYRLNKLIHQRKSSL